MSSEQSRLEFEAIEYGGRAGMFVFFPPEALGWLRTKLFDNRQYWINKRDWYADREEFNRAVFRINGKTCKAGNDPDER